MNSGDLRTLGPMVSPFLLAATLTQAARYSSRDDAVEMNEYFAKRALQLLVKEIDRGSSIPAIQGLLIFSSRECACGRTSQGWLYSGMAFRMARDLGMHVAPKKLGPLSSRFSDEDLALRRQIFWSCYTWDKTMSLCLGRPPQIKETIELPTVETLLDGRDADDEIWQPITDHSSLSQSLLNHRTLSSTRFAAYCELCVIIDNVLDKLYSRPHRAQRDHMLAYLTQMLEKLDDWAARLPSELLIKEDSKAVLCPPLHILLLNLLYYSTAILLCRPYRTVSNTARARCTKAARMSDTLFTLHVRRFGFRCITWLQTYTMFVACTINVLDFKESKAQDGLNVDPALAQEASARLGFGLEVLRQAGATPSAARCASIISQLLQNSGDLEKDARTGTVEPARPPTESRRTKSNEGSGGTRTLTSQRTRPTSGSPTKPPEGIGTDHNSGLVTDFSGQPMPAHHQAAHIHTGQSPAIRPAEATLHDMAPSPYRNEMMLGNPQFSNDILPPVNPDMNRSGIETPFRWLPDNVCDDGSWMLMDIDFDSWPVFNVLP